MITIAISRIIRHTASIRTSSESDFDSGPIDIKSIISRKKLTFALN